MRESLAQNNLGITFRLLRRYDEARDALHTALTLHKPYGHTAMPWKTWAELAEVEGESGRPSEAAEARAQAIATYRAYRDDGGEPIDGATQFIAAFGEQFRTSGPAAARALLDRTEFVPAFTPLVRALQAIAAGRRDPALAEDPAHDPRIVVELRLLLASLPPP
jgi:tetratricopeptide (TPR) repeat protein